MSQLAQVGDINVVDIRKFFAPIRLQQYQAAQAKIRALACGRHVLMVTVDRARESGNSSLVMAALRAYHRMGREQDHLTNIKRPRPALPRLRKTA